MEKQQIRLFVMTGLLLLPAAAAAQVNCVVDRAVFMKNITLQGADITIGADVPTGTVIYQGIASNRKDPTGNSGMTCQYSHAERFTLEGYLQLAGGGGEVSPGIYATSLPGVGLRLHNWTAGGDTTTPLSQTARLHSFSVSYPRPDGLPCSENSTNCNIPAGVGFKFELVKTGDIAAGQINGAIFPHISITISSPTPGTKVSAAEVARMHFSGTLNMKTASCRTPGDYTVELGKYEIRNISAKKSSPWVDASIILTGCPRFTGMPGTKSSIWVYPSNTPTKTSVYKNNLLEVTLTPLTDIRSASAGTFVVEKKVGSASGVDIQLNRGTAANNSPVVLKQPYTIDIPNDGRQSLSVPLVARYLRNNEALSPGIANGKVVYLINYK